MNKICKECNCSLPLEAFGSNKGGALGLRAKCLQCEKVRKAKHYLTNQENILSNKKDYYNENLEHIKQYNFNYNRERLQYDPLFKLKKHTAALIRNSMKASSYNKGGRKTIELLGCDLVFFRQHLQDQFTPEMTWNNYGSYWSIDHICPCSQAQTEHEMIALQHHSNLRPMKSYGQGGNLTKSNSWTPEGEVLCIKLLNRSWIEGS